MQMVVNVSPSLASVVDVSSPSVMSVDGQEISVFPQNISRGIADDQSYVLTYDIDQKYADLFVNNEYVEVFIPIETKAQSENEILVPLDAVRLMNEGSIIFIVENDIARSRVVTTGEVVGGFIFVKGDISENDSIILNRNVFDGDRVDVAGS